jgi:hypothetical protein
MWVPPRANTLFILPLSFAKEKRRFFEAGEAHPCQHWLPACNFAVMFGVWGRISNE